MNGTKKQEAACAATDPNRCGTLSVIEARIKKAVGYDGKPYKAGIKRPKVKGKGARK